MKTYFKPLEVLEHHPVTKESDAAFLLLIQHAALLGLKDSGVFIEMQFRMAEDALYHQFGRRKL